MGKRTLTIIDTTSHLTEISLDDFGKSELLLGRNPETNDIVIQDRIVSKRHGVFRLTDGRLTYMDLDSTNGTYVGNAAQKILLSQQNGFVEIYDKSVLRIGNIHAPEKMLLILYRVTEEKEVWKKAPNRERMGIGRSGENEIVLPHPGVSRNHGMIQKENGEFVLHALSSGNGIMVNGCTITKPTVLQDKDLIQILDYQLLFSTECIYYKAVTEGISVRVNNINKFVGRGKKKKQILKDVSCEIHPNEFVAIIGGSGAGKTTLMTAISGFETTFQGQVFCNDINLVEQFQNLKNIIGFVPQQDIIYENLTLRRMLEYTAKMKMPKDTKKSEVQKQIDEVLDMVELKEHQYTYIRKLSGGQKKRASIAVELLADPRLFFLDEPTSGLDPGTEKNLMLTLSRLSKEKNKTIIMVTHTTANLHLCDKIIFMGPGGRLCFCGDVDEAKAFYRTDDLVNIYNMIAENPQGCEQRYAAYRDKNRHREYESMPGGSMPDGKTPGGGMPDGKTSGGRTLGGSMPGGRTQDGRMSGTVINGSNAQEKSSETEIFRKKKDSAIRQYRILSQRYGELLVNDRPRLLVLLLQPLLIAVLLNLVADEKIFKIYESTKSMMFALSCSGIWIGLFDSIQEICKERVIVKREYMANLKLPGYILSKFTLQAILGCVQALILSFVFLRLVEADKEGIFLEHFQLEIFFTVWLTVMASITMGFVISAIMKTGDKAMTLAPFVLIIQLLFSGILFALEGAGEIISYCTVSRWSVEALGSISRLNKLELKLQADYPQLQHEAESFFKASKAHLQQSWLILGGMVILFTVVSTIALRRIAKDSR